MTTAADPALLWRRFALLLAGVAAGATLALYLAVLALDPYGIRTRPGRAQAPIMDLNQRFMYPQIVRGGRFDSAVFGTSTLRLLDPERLDALFGGRFANLGINAGTPWEQTRLVDLFLRHVPRPRALVLGLDTPWCEADADQPAKRLTFRVFPPWLYDDDPLNDLPELLDLKSLEIAGRLALHRLGLMPERIRGDGYEVFTPPEGSYDLARARLHLWGAAGPRPLDPVTPPARLSEVERAALRFPALPWLEGLLARLPRGTALTLVLPPIHAGSQPRPGSPDAAREEACKARIAAIGAAAGATVVDFRIVSPVTLEDANYWDPQHYRLPVAERIAVGVARARETGADDPEGVYRVLAHGGRVRG